MEIKVKAVEGYDNKSKAEVEQELLKKHEDSLDNQDSDVPKIDTSALDKPTEEKNNDESEVDSSQDKTPSSELNDEDVLSFIKKRYNKEINSVDDLFAEKEANPELPEDVSAYFKYKQETGRGIEDFYKLQKDYDSMSDDDVLVNYYQNIEEGLDDEDIKDLIDDKFTFDEELDEPKDVKKIKLAKKRELAKAKKFLNEQKDKYKVPLESSGGGLSEDQEKNLNAYKSYIEESKTVAEANKKRHEYFKTQTQEVFNNEFKGFEFNISDDLNLTYKPGTADELRNKQSDVNNFLLNFIDKDSGLVNDAVNYHKALAVAMNPEKFARYFYEQGVANAVDDVTKKSKNINMDVRKAPRSFNKNGLKIKTVQSKSESSGRGLKIRSIKKS
tara:strand:- start:654 stop:1811 length:1158 start_codon:yes stop_codon:yes gene_type:complete